MTDEAHTAALARLDEEIRAYDAQGTPKAEWHAAWAVYEKAELVERAEGEDAAVDLYAEVVRRLEHRRDAGPRTLLIPTMNTVAHIHQRHDRDAEARAVAQKLVDEHFDDAPTDVGDAVAQGALLLAWMLRRSMEFEEALALLARVKDRYGRPGVPDHRQTAALARCEIAWTLRGAAEPDDALDRLERLIVELGDPAEAGLRAVLARALLGKAYALSDLNRVAERIAVCRDIVARFGSEDEPATAEEVAQAREMLDERWSDGGYAWHVLGYRLYGRVGGAPAAARAFRQAIDDGRVDSWVHLGIALSAMPGREDEEECAFRRALESDDDETASYAALKLGNVLQWLRGDLDSARECFALAAERGSGITAGDALVNLGHLAAYQGDREAARRALSEGIVILAEVRCGVDLSDSSDGPARVHTTLASSRATRRLFRRYRRLNYVVPRFFRALVKSSIPAQRLGRLSDSRSPARRATAAA